jgi:predicted transcriptional regulator
MSDETSVTVNAVMTPEVKMIDGLAPVQEAIELMRNDGISSLIIDRRHEGDEFGLVVVGDIAREVIGRNRSAARTNVYEIMSKPVLTVASDMDIKYAIRLLDRFDLSRALVIEAGRLVGLVTMRDMVLRYMRDAEG